jgi:predicted SAM-dependent methyltransferase
MYLLTPYVHMRLNEGLTYIKDCDHILLEQFVLRIAVKHVHTKDESTAHGHVS